MPRGQRAAKNDTHEEETEGTGRKNAPRRSPQQKANDDLEAARKRLVKANDSYEEAQAKAEEAKAEYERSVKIFDHASHHPDLEQPVDDESEADGVVPVGEVVHPNPDTSEWDEEHGDDGDE